VWLVLTEESDVLKAVVDLGDAELVVTDYFLVSDEGDEIDELDDESCEDRLVAAFWGLLVKMVGVLARLDLSVKVNFGMDHQPDDLLGRAMERALDNAPRSVSITPEFCEEARQHALEEHRQTEEFLKRLKKDMQVEGLQRGLDKEAREGMTLRDL